MKGKKLSKRRKKCLVRDMMIGCAIGFMGANLFGCSEWADTLIIGMAFSMFATYGVIATDDVFPMMDRRRAGTVVTAVKSGESAETARYPRPVASVPFVTILDAKDDTL